VSILAGSGQKIYGSISWVGFQAKGFRAKAVSKKSILQLKSVYKSSGNGFKILFRSSQQAIGSGHVLSVQVRELVLKVLDSTV